MANRDPVEQIEYQKIYTIILKRVSDNRMTAKACGKACAWKDLAPKGWKPARYAYDPDHRQSVVRAWSLCTFDAVGEAVATETFFNNAHNMSCSEKVLQINVYLNELHNRPKSIDAHYLRLLRNQYSQSFLSAKMTPEAKARFVEWRDSREADLLHDRVVADMRVDLNSFHQESVGLFDSVVTNVKGSKSGKNKTILESVFKCPGRETGLINAVSMGASACPLLDKKKQCFTDVFAYSLNEWLVKTHGDSEKGLSTVEHDYLDKGIENYMGNLHIQVPEVDFADLHPKGPAL